MKSESINLQCELVLLIFNIIISKVIKSDLNTFWNFYYYAN